MVFESQQSQIESIRLCVEQRTFERKRSVKGAISINYAECSLGFILHFSNFSLNFPLNSIQLDVHCTSDFRLKLKIKICRELDSEKWHVKQTPQTWK